MTNSIMIGKVIYQKLKDLAGGRIYPVVAEQSTVYPFVVYYRTAVQNTNYNKDGYSEDAVSFTVCVVSDKYNESCTLAHQVRERLECQRIKGNGMVITSIRITGIDESYEDNAYVQRLNFECIVNND